VSDDVAPRGGGRPAGFPRGAQHHQKLDAAIHRSKVRVGILGDILDGIFFANSAIYYLQRFISLLFINWRLSLTILK